MTRANAVPEVPALVQRRSIASFRVFAPERVVLFGSYAKGTTHCGSDVDLLVIANIVGNPAVHQRHAQQLAADCFPAIDIVLATPAEVAEAGTAKSPFLLSVLETGRTIYTAPGHRD